MLELSTRCRIDSVGQPHNTSPLGFVPYTQYICKIKCENGALSGEKHRRTLNVSEKDAWIIFLDFFFFYIDDKLAFFS